MTQVQCGDCNVALKSYIQLWKHSANIENPASTLGAGTSASSALWPPAYPLLNSVTCQAFDQSPLQNTVGWSTRFGEYSIHLHIDQRVSEACLGCRQLLPPISQSATNSLAAPSPEQSPPTKEAHMLMSHTKVLVSKICNRRNGYLLMPAMYREVKREEKNGNM